VNGPAAILAQAAGDKGLRLELMVDSPDEPDRLNGCGLFALNPPWTLQEEANAILPALAERLARGAYGAYRCEPLGAIDVPSH
jgi:23S rRNA (adenine2030-N6)-methyltransferase